MKHLEGPREGDRGRARLEIVEVAARLLDAGGAGAVTTRAVAVEAGVQAPTIYRLFGDKDGLIDAVAEHVFATYVQTKTASKTSADPVADLDQGWRTHIEFGLANPALFVLLSDPERGSRLVASAGGLDILRERVHRVAVAGRLKVTEQRAVDMIHAAGTGVVHALLTKPPEQRDHGLADALYAATKQAIVTDVANAPSGGPAAAAVALGAGLSDVNVLTDAERALLTDWLDRIADQ